MEDQAKTIKITDPAETSSKEHANPWVILIIDDVQSVLDVTCSVLKHLEFEGRGVQLQCAKSAEEAKELYRRYSNPAVILVDCVMESDTAGLEFIEFIRNEQNNHKTQVVLRTGQPGAAPEHEVLEQHHINDYLSKTELSSAKLRSRVTAYLRNYQTISLLSEQVEKPESMEADLYDYTLACSVASEMKSPLAQISHNLQKIRETVPDLLHPEMDVSLLDRLYRNLDSSQYAVKYSEKMINFLLKEGENQVNNSESLVYLSAQQLTQQTVNHYLTANPSYKGKVTVEHDDDFLLCVSGKRYSKTICVLLDRAFENLAESPDLAVTISLQADTGCHKIRITDTGPALSPEQQEQLFDIDSIYEPESEDEPTLAYCKRSMNTFNGSINCYSAEGSSTEFTLSFPVVLPIADEHNEFNYIPQPRVFSKGILVGKTILVIADEANVISNVLIGLGVNIIKVTDRKQAIDTLKQTACDLVITGLTMPVVDRLEFVRAVRALDNQNKSEDRPNPVSILALIEQENSALAKACFQSGIDALVFMPLEKDELVNILVQQFNFTHADES